MGSSDGFVSVPRKVFEYLCFCFDIFDGPYFGSSGIGDSEERNKIVYGITATHVSSIHRTDALAIDI